MYSHKTNLNNILLIIKKYVKKYNDIYNLPYYKNIINQSEKEEYFNYSDYIINRDESLYNLINKNDELYPLIYFYLFLLHHLPYILRVHNHKFYQFLHIYF